MKFLRKLLLPLLSILLVAGNQTLGNLYSYPLGVSSSVKHTTKADVNARDCTKQGGNVSAKTPVGKRGHKTGTTDTGPHNPELQIITRNTDTVIEGRKFTGHALDKMQSRGVISPRAVSDTIKNPTKVISGNEPGTQVYIKDNIKVVANANGDVVTVMWE